MNAFDADVTVTVRAATSAPSAANGTCRAAGGQLGVDLVADDGQVVAGGDLGELLQLGPGEHVPGRVVRVAEQQQAGRLGRSRAGGQLVVVEPPRAVDELRPAPATTRRPAAAIVPRNGW